MARYNIQKIVLAVLLGLVEVAGAQTESVTSRIHAKTSEVQPVNQAPSGPQESMGIHGHWIVTVRNADGTVASRQEFENNLTNQGKGFVLGVLIGDIFPLRGLPISWQLKISGKPLQEP